MTRQFRTGVCCCCCCCYCYYCCCCCCCCWKLTKKTGRKKIKQSLLPQFPPSPIRLHSLRPSPLLPPSLRWPNSPPISPQLHPLHLSTSLLSLPPSLYPFQSPCPHPHLPFLFRRRIGEVGGKEWRRGGGERGLKRAERLDRGGGGDVF